MDTPCIFREWTNVGLLATATVRAYPRLARVELERGIYRGAGDGRLDLWIALGTDLNPQFDCAIEAKRCTESWRPSRRRIGTIVGTAVRELASCEAGSGSLTSQRIGMVTLLVHRDKTASAPRNRDLDALESELWSRIESDCPARASAMMMSVAHRSGDSAPADDQLPVATFLIAFVA
jgi:hypothetical protein